jgi:hypothetical protein
VNTTQWKEKITEWLQTDKLKRRNFLFIECKDCKRVSFVRVSLLLDKFDYKWECGCGCKFWKLKTEGLGEWKRSAKCQLGLLSVEMGMKFKK